MDATLDDAYRALPFETCEILAIADGTAESDEETAITQLKAALGA